MRRALRERIRIQLSGLAERNHYRALARRARWARHRILKRLPVGALVSLDGAREILRSVGLPYSEEQVFGVTVFDVEDGPLLYFDPRGLYAGFERRSGLLGSGGEVLGLDATVLGQDLLGLGLRDIA